MIPHVILSSQPWCLDSTCNFKQSPVMSHNSTCNLSSQLICVTIPRIILSSQRWWVSILHFNFKQSPVICHNSTCTLSSQRLCVTILRVILSCQRICVTNQRVIWRSHRLCITQPCVLLSSELLWFTIPLLFQATGVMRHDSTIYALRKHVYCSGPLCRLLASLRKITSAVSIM